MQDMHDFFSAHGPLAGAVDDFVLRPQQQEMAQAVADAIEQGDALVCEAGTGTGKTFAYLAPALLSGRRVIISTGTKHLQDQLYQRDLPVVRRALGSPVKTALLKGRANYLCLHRLTLAEQEGEFRSREAVRDLAAVRRWQSMTRSGDISEAGVAEDSTIWPQVTSTAENCLGSDCPVFDQCFVVKARRAAQEAGLVVINHHLLLADMVLKEEGFGELLPGADAIIVDEAHQLPETAGQYFGEQFSSRQVQDLCRDIRAEVLKLAADSAQLTRLLDQADKAAKDARLIFGTGTDTRLNWEAICRAPVQAALHELQDATQAVHDALLPLAEQARGLQRCQERAAMYAARLDLFLEGETATDEARVRWGELHRRSFVLHITPIETAARFRAQREAQPCAWIYTSATLAVGGSAGHFSRQLGLEAPQEKVLDSPFDYAANAMLYLPSGMPEPNSPQYTRRVLDIARPLLIASAGRAFLLFTSHRALREAAEGLQDIPHPLLIQNTAPRSQLLEEFRRRGDAVLLGTASFWEGVDVKGPALSLVIIDKLPFASPGDPVFAARLEALRRAGRNPFTEYQLPQAIIALKQGAGRLIRDSNDTGVLVVCDPRLTGKGYGRHFLASLPPLRRSRDPDEVCEFLQTRTYLPQAAPA